MISIKEYVQEKGPGSIFILSAVNLKAATREEFHDAVAGYVEAGSGEGFVVTESRRDSMGPGLYTLVFCRRTP